MRQRLFFGKIMRCVDHAKVFYHDLLCRIIHCCRKAAGLDDVIFNAMIKAFPTSSGGSAAGEGPGAAAEGPGGSKTIAQGSDKQKAGKRPGTKRRRTSSLDSGSSAIDDFDP